MADEIALHAVMEARRFLQSVTPLRCDCGAGCGRLCCQPDEDGRGGMLLFPGEAALYQNKPWARLTPDESIEPSGTLLVCEGTCPRDERPLSCRLFPILPEVRLSQEKPRLSLRMDARANMVCPLFDDGLRALDPGFIEATERAARALYACPRTREFLYRLTLFVDENYRLWREAR